MVAIRRLVISPPLINSSSLAASEPDQLQELFDSAHTGAVTTRTATLTSFNETSEHAVRFLSNQILFLGLTASSRLPSPMTLSRLSTRTATHRIPFLPTYATWMPSYLALLSSQLSPLS